MDIPQKVIFYTHGPPEGFTNEYKQRKLFKVDTPLKRSTRVDRAVLRQYGWRL